MCVTHQFWSVGSPGVESERDRRRYIVPLGNERSAWRAGMAWCLSNEVVAAGKGKKKLLKQKAGGIHEAQPWAFMAGHEEISKGWPCPTFSTRATWRFPEEKKRPVEVQTYGIHQRLSQSAR